MPDKRFKEGSEEYFEKLIDKKAIVYACLDWDFFRTTKFYFLHVFKQTNIEYCLMPEPRYILICSTILRKHKKIRM